MSACRSTLSPSLATTQVLQTCAGGAVWGTTGKALGVFAARHCVQCRSKAIVSTRRSVQACSRSVGTGVMHAAGCRAHAANKHSQVF